MRVSLPRKGDARYAAPPEHRPPRRTCIAPTPDPSTLTAKVGIKARVSVPHFVSVTGARGVGTSGRPCAIREISTCSTRPRGRIVTLWHRFRRGTAHVLDATAGNRRGRALVTLSVVLGLGVGGYLTIAAVTGGTSTGPPDSAAPPVPGESHLADPPQPELRTRWPDTEGKSLGVRRIQDPANRSHRRPANVTEPLAPDQETDAPTTPSTSPSPTRLREPRDVTPPNTNMSEAQPEPDAARFTFSADEGASLVCSLDGGGFTPCNSPERLLRPARGWAQLRREGRRRRGNAHPSPAETRWLAKNRHATGP